MSCLQFLKFVRSKLGYSFKVLVLIFRKRVVPDFGNYLCRVRLFAVANRESKNGHKHNCYIFLVF